MIRTATPDDIPTIAELIRALADYERLAHEVVLDEDALRAHLFGARPYAEVLIAQDDDGRTNDAGDGARATSAPGNASRPVVGFALFFHTFSTFLGKPGIWLEDLFVRPEHRGRGYGRALCQNWRASASNAVAGASNGLCSTGMHRRSPSTARSAPCRWTTGRRTGSRAMRSLP